MLPLVFNLGPTELLIILAIVLLLFGGSRLAGLGKSTGRALKEFKEETKGLKAGEQAPGTTPVAPHDLAPGSAQPYAQPPAQPYAQPPAQPYAQPPAYGQAPAYGQQPAQPPYPAQPYAAPASPESYGPGAPSSGAQSSGAHPVDGDRR